MPSSLFQSKPNPIQMISKFKEFSKGMTPSLAKQQVEELLKSGKMTSAQLESLKNKAQEFMNFLR